jgi:penicillin amidase
VAAFDYDKPFRVTAIPSYRQIIDWGRPDVSLSMHSTGQSGMAFSPHYGDMIQSWLQVKYHYIYHQKGMVEQNSKEKLFLQPLNVNERDK